MREDVLLKIKPSLQSYLEKLGFCLVDLRFYKNHFGELVLEVLVDRAEGGISLGECAELNKSLAGIVEEGIGLQGSYTLDVSSPGLDRPLLTLSDFKRTLGRDLRIFLKEAHDGKVEYRGISESVDENQLTIKTNDAVIQIPMDKINRAKQVIS